MKLHYIGLLAVGLSLCAAGSVWAQFAADDPDWKESEAPLPPAFNAGKLIQFEVSPTSSLVYGVDPASIRISQRDGVVRYVIVARSANGASNVMYEGLRCSTGQVKTYARHSESGGWKNVDKVEWNSLFAGASHRHSLAFAKAGACDNKVVPDSVDALVRRLKNPALAGAQ